jgi:peptidoglycan/xylan/chitin deacetylase (PgdA/CDA1 family)
MMRSLKLGLASLVLSLGSFATPYVKQAPAKDIPILMYHHIGTRENRFTVSPKRLEDHLKQLHRENYHLRTFTEMQQGTQGKTAVLTFDDSTEDQFRFLSDGSIDPTSAVGILEKYRKQHPDYRVTATFFINIQTQQGKPVFEQEGLEAKKLQYLVNHGYEIGSHGYKHHNFAKLSAEQIREDLTKFQDKMAQLVPEYQVKSFAYPYGSLPDSARQRVVEEFYPITAHAWGGMAHASQDHNVPRIETGPQTHLAQYLRSHNSFEQKRKVVDVNYEHLVTQVLKPREMRNPSEQAKVYIPERLTAPTLPSENTRYENLLNVLDRENNQLMEPEHIWPARANLYKQPVNLTTYARNDSQLPTQHSQAQRQPDDRGSRWYGLPREGNNSRGKERGLQHRQEGDQGRDPLSPWQQGSTACTLRNRYAWSGYWPARDDPVIPKAPDLLWELLRRWLGNKFYL